MHFNSLRLRCVAVPSWSAADFQPVHRDFNLPSALLEHALLHHGYKKVSANLYNEQFVQKPRFVAASDDAVCSCKEGDQCEENCINRAMHIECSRRCGKGDKCQNQRLTRRQYANTTIVKVNTSQLQPHTAAAVFTLHSLTRPTVHLPALHDCADCRPRIWFAGRISDR